MKLNNGKQIVLTDQDKARIAAGIQLLLVAMAVNGTVRKEVKDFKKSLKKRKKKKSK